MSIGRSIRSLVVFARGITAASGVLTLVHFAWSVNQADSSNLSGLSRLFYEHAYSASSAKIKYLAAKANLPATWPQFGPVLELVRRYGLQGRRVPENSAGALQDVAEHYVGLDIAESAGTNFQEPSVQGSVTDLSFADGQFDVIWTVWPLEHVPNPEKVLSEMRIPKGTLASWMMPSRASTLSPWAR
jgi:SAM-dependent methyltransferase